MIDHLFRINEGRRPRIIYVTLVRPTPQDPSSYRAEAESRVAAQVRRDVGRGAGHGRPQALLKTKEPEYDKHGYDARPTQTLSTQESSARKKEKVDAQIALGPHRGPREFGGEQSRTKTTAPPRRKLLSNFRSESLFGMEQGLKFSNFWFMNGRNGMF